MKEVSAYSFNGKNYLLVTKINQYLFLVNEADSKDMMIRKEDENDKQLLLPLEDDEEFEQALLLLVNQKLEQEEID